jgi:SH3 domain protein
VKKVDFPELIFGFLIIFFAALSANATTAYVTDKLRLAVHEAHDTSDKAFTYAESGDALEILERNRSYAKVILPDGSQGWVRAAYLVDKQPARLRVAELEKSHDELAAELEQMKSGSADRYARLAQQEMQLEEQTARIEAERAELQSLRQINNDLESRLKQYGFSVPGILALSSVFLALLLGFSAAWYWLDERARKRHGGYRVY